MVLLYFLRMVQKQPSAGCKSVLIFAFFTEKNNPFFADHKFTKNRASAAIFGKLTCVALRQ